MRWIKFIVFIALFVSCSNNKDSKECETLPANEVDNQREEKVVTEEKELKDTIENKQTIEFYTEKDLIGYSDWKIKITGRGVDCEYTNGNSVLSVDFDSIACLQAGDTLYIKPISEGAMYESDIFVSEFETKREIISFYRKEHSEFKSLFYDELPGFAFFCTDKDTVTYNCGGDIDYSLSVIKITSDKYNLYGFQNGKDVRQSIKDIGITNNIINDQIKYIGICFAGRSSDHQRIDEWFYLFVKIDKKMRAKEITRFDYFNRGEPATVLMGGTHISQSYDQDGVKFRIISKYEY